MSEDQAPKAILESAASDFLFNESFQFENESLSDPDDDVSRDDLGDVDSLSEREKLEEDDEDDEDDDDGDDGDDDDDDDALYYPPSFLSQPSYGRLVSAGTAASWSLCESMDNDHFFLVPPSGIITPPVPGAGTFSQRSLVLPSSAVRRSGEGTYPISPRATRFHSGAGTSSGEGSTYVAARRPDENTQPHASTATGRSENVPSHTIGHIVSPTGVAIHTLAGTAEPGQPSTAAFVRYRARSGNQQQNRQPERPNKQRPPRARSPAKHSLTGNSLAYSVSTGGGSTKRSSIAGSDNEGATPFVDFYQDDQSLYLDDDCLTDCAEPSYNTNKAFVTSKDVDDATVTRAHEKPPLLKLWQTLINFCRPERIVHTTVPNKPSKPKAGSHSRSKSDPEMLANMLEDRLIMTKRSVETAPFERASSRPPVSQVTIKFRPSQITSSCVQELAFQIDSKADFVLDDARSLPDDV